MVACCDVYVTFWCSWKIGEPIGKAKKINSKLIESLAVGGTCIGLPSITILKLLLADFWQLCYTEYRSIILNTLERFKILCFMLFLIPFCLHFISNIIVSVNAIVVLCIE